MYKAIYRAYRPEIFEDVIGQDYIIRVLKSQIARDEVSHAYLFCGTRGTGKTTVARLLAKAVNCTADGERPCGHCENCRAIQNGTFMDLIEIDAASNNGVDNVRELRESVNYPPVAGRKKVYILDEVHMLSTPAFNALLKTLEEPPENVMFVLCTTEPEKLPATVLSRCMRMDFHRVSERELVERMDLICRDRGLEADQSALRLVATLADGSVRDGLSLLEQCISGQEETLTRDNVLEAIGAVGEETFIELTEAVRTGNVARGLLLIDRMMDSGKDARQIIQGWMGHFRNLLLVRYMENPEDVISMSVENIDRVRSQSDALDIGAVTGAIRELARILYDARRSSQPRILLEMAMIKLASGDSDDTVDVTFRRMEKAEAGPAPAAKYEPERPAAPPARFAAPEKAARASQTSMMPPAGGTGHETGKPASGQARETAPEPAESKPAFEPEPADTAPAFEPEPADTAPAFEPEPADTAPAFEPEQADTAPAFEPEPADTAPAFEPEPADTAPAFEPEPADTAPAFEPEPAGAAQVPGENPGRQESSLPRETPREPEPAEDMTAIWNKFLDNGERVIGAMFYAIRGSAEPVSIEGDTVKIRVGGSAASYMEHDMERITKLMSAVRGRTSYIELVSEGKPADSETAGPPADDEEAERVRRMASDLLGVDVKLR